MELPASFYEFDRFTLDLARGCVLKDDEEVKLRPKVFEALKYMVENAGRLVSKQELIQAVWPDTFVTDDSLVQCTVELRRALDDRDQQILKTVPRRGYVFAATVVERRARPQSANDSDSHALKPSFRSGRVSLPVTRTSLIGRAREVNEAVTLLLREDVRLLTLTGPGGAGKTRLSLAIAEKAASRFVGGAQFISLASLTHAERVPAALVQALGIQASSESDVAERIAEHLRESGPFLLILDNFEQVLEAAGLVATALADAPALKILVTSRSALRIYGEQEFPVAPLEENSAVELFVQRANAVRPSLTFTSESEAAIREICARLDGLPLAIELAAARTKVLSPNAILDRLQSRLQLLTGGPRDLPERQQTLRKTIDWSYDLLNEAEQRLFRRLSVFVGGCTPEGAEAVCNATLDLGVETFDGLASLVDKNLLQRVERDDVEPRFTMLQTVREYASERLVESGEHASVRRAHAAYCLVLAEEGNPELNASDRSRWLEQCDIEIDNLRYALDWLTETNDVDWSLRLGMALFRFWDMREHLNEGRARLEAVMRMAGDDHNRDRAKIFHFLGALATAQGDYQAGIRFLEQSLSLYEALGDQWGIAASLNALAVSARDRGDYSSAETNFERSLACWRLMSDRLATARCLHNLANVVKVRGDYERAKTALNEATYIFEQMGDRSGAAWSVNQLGDISREQGNNRGARSYYDRALAIFRESGDHWGCARTLTDLAGIDSEEGEYLSAHDAYREALKVFASLGHRRGTARALEGYAVLALSENQFGRALKLAAAASHLRRLISAPLTPAEQQKLDAKLRPAWESLSEEAGRTAWTEGYAMGIQNAVQYCLESTVNSR